MIGGQAGPRPRRAVVPVWLPWDTLQTAGQLARLLQRIQADTEIARQLIGCKKSVKFPAEQAAHPRKESIREHTYLQTSFIRDYRTTSRPKKQGRFSPTASPYLFPGK